MKCTCGVILIHEIKIFLYGKMLCTNYRTRSVSYLMQNVFRILASYPEAVKYVHLSNLIENFEGTLLINIQKNMLYRLEKKRTIEPPFSQ
jgi:hypothetical protein